MLRLLPGYSPSKKVSVGAEEKDHIPSANIDAEDRHVETPPYCADPSREYRSTGDIRIGGTR